MTDARIRAGDVCIDLVERGKIFVMERAAISVRKHREREDYNIDDYKANSLLDVGNEETVWTCVYLPDKPQTEFSGTYDFPESRLARVPVEEASQDLRRSQERLIVSVLESLFGAVRRSGSEETNEIVTSVARDALDEDLVDEARELADVEQTVPVKERDDE